MATFNPFGFQWAYSTSAASQASPTLVEFPWDSDFSGWSGDLAVQYLPGDDATSKSTADGFVYPGYTRTDIAPADSRILNYPPIVGVIAGFRYQPVNDSSMNVDVWPSYVAGTEVKDDKITVVVNTDIQGRYNIQYKGTTGDGLGVQQEFLFGQAELGGLNEFAQTVGGNVFYFAKGIPNSSVGSASGGIPGTSTLYLTNLATQADTLAGNSLMKSSSYPVFLQTPATGNTWYDPADPNRAQNENTIMTVLLNNNFTTTSWESILLQNPS
jgi:hypothetical protein